MRYQVNSGSQISSTGSKAQMILKFVAMETVTGHQFSLIVNGKILTFIQSMFGDDSGLSIPMINITLDQYVYAIFEALKLNYTLRSNYDFLLGDSTPGERLITLISKEVGTKWTLIFDNISMVGLSMNFNQVGTDQVIKDNFSIVCSMWTDKKVIQQGGNAPHPIAVTQTQLFKIAEDLNLHYS